jgi:site-specific DNA-methyltransferase (adenine-specific)
MSNVKMFKYCWVWDKKTATGGAISSYQPMRAHEDVCVFYKESCAYAPQMTKFSEDEVKRMRKHDFVCKNAQVIGIGTNISKGWFDGKKKFPKTVIRINGIAPNSAEKKAGRHPTQKPVALMEYLIRTYTNEGETVLDFTMGSGTTGVACKNLGRSFIGIEMDADYFAAASKRIADTPERLAIDG